MSDPEALIPAATVVLVRDRPSKLSKGIETLMLRRNSKIAFGGAWVFPGGRVEEDDRNLASALLGESHDLAASRIAAAREAKEESGLDVSHTEMISWSYWVPPPMAAIPIKGPKRRFSTWFFVARAPSGDVVVDGGEIHDHQWLSPSEALAKQRAGDIELMPPTWVTLSQIASFASSAELIASGARHTPEEFRTERLEGKPPVLAWCGDAEHSATAAEERGGVHRITLDKAGWHYQRS